jgi:hypothetical protein
MLASTLVNIIKYTAVSRYSIPLQAVPGETDHCSAHEVHSNDHEQTSMQVLDQQPSQLFQQ